MISLILSSKCEKHLEMLCEVMDEETGQIWNPAEFVENFILALDPEMLRDAYVEDKER